jgi:hypothetical protein
MSEAGNADYTSKRKRWLLSRVTALASLIIAYILVYVIVENLLQVARAGNPYIGYNVSLSSVSFYVTSILILLAVLVVYLFMPSPFLLDLVIFSGFIFILAHYTYISSVVGGRGSRLEVKVLPLIMEYIGDNGHVSLALDLGQIVALGLGIAGYQRLKPFLRKGPLS